MNTSIKTSEKEYSIREIIIVIGKSIRFLQSRWPILLTACLLGSLIGIGAAWFSPVTYSSKVSFVLEEGKAGGGGLSAIAGQFGFDLGGGGGGSTILSGDNILGLLKSRKFVRTTLLSLYTPKLSLADKYAEVYGYHKQWKESKHIGRIIFFPSNSVYSRLQDSLLMVIENDAMTRISVARTDKKMSFFEVNASFKDELLSKYFTERLVNYAVEFYVETKTRRQRANVDRLQRRADSIAGLLNRSTYKAAAIQSSILDINPAYGTATVPAEVSSRDKLMVGTIYAEIVKNLELQKATLTQETPVIQIVDEALLPLKKNKKSKVFFLIIGGIFALVITSLLLLIRKFLRNF